MNLVPLLQAFLPIDERWMRDITGLTLDSRRVKAGDLFLAYPGLLSDGRDYIDAAVSAGAHAVIQEGETAGFTRSVDGVPIFSLPGLQQQVSFIADDFYGLPSKHMTVIGVTGTNGKTSIAYYLASLLNTTESPARFIGTLGYGLGEDYQTLGHTTPDPITVQRLLAEFHSQGVKTVVMEVSSHALEQARVSGVRFDTAVFTNLSHEHLDYHGTMEAYGAAKEKLFHFPSLTQAVINGADAFGRELIEKCASRITTVVFATGEHVEALPQGIQAVTSESFSLHAHGCTARVHTPWGEGTLQTDLLGQFNLSNLLAVLSVMGLYGLSLDESLGRIQALKPALGRMQVVGEARGVTAVVDYAHTPDALEKALNACRAHCQGRLHLVFGCGGDRDKAKRPLMGQVAERLADTVILTNDNPRSESPEAITQEIASGLQGSYQVELDRAKAISLALAAAQRDDFVLVAGKGHEDYQLIGDKRLDFSDIRCVQAVLEDSNK